MKTAFAAALSTKVIVGVAAAAAAAAATGGIALVASQGALHSNGHAHSSTPPVSVTTDANTADVNTTGPTTPSATPSPNLVGLCTAYEKGVQNSKGKALENPAFSVLASAAVAAGDTMPGYPGTPDIATFCTDYLATNAPSAKHTTGKPADLPTQATDHPTGKPSDHPGSSTTHP